MLSHLGFLVLEKSQIEWEIRILLLGVGSRSKQQAMKFFGKLTGSYTLGVHYILSKSSCEAINDIWKRLWLEAEYSIQVAEWLTKQVSVKVEIDMDYNSDENHKSNKLISATKGWANSLGYKVNVKPNNQIATRAADHHCK